MEEVVQVAGILVTIFVAIGTGLLTWIALMTQAEKRAVKEDKALVNLRLEKHEGWILKQQEELSDQSKKTEVAIELIKQEQKQGQERLRIFREEFFQHKTRGKRK